MHQTGHREFQLAAVDHHRGIHGEQIVFAGVVDVQVRVQDVTDVAETQAMFLQLVLDHGFVALQAAHAERFRDLVRAVAGIDQDRPSAAEYQRAEHQNAARAAAIASEH